MGVSEKRRRDGRIILLYKGLRVLTAFQQMTLSPHLGAIETFQIHTARTDIYKGSFFPETIRDWNTLPNSRGREFKVSLH